MTRCEERRHAPHYLLQRIGRGPTCYREGFAQPHCEAAGEEHVVHSREIACVADDAQAEQRCAQGRANTVVAVAAPT